MNPTTLESALPHQLNFYAQTLLERLDYSSDPSALETIFEGEVRRFASRIWITAGRSYGLHFEFYGDADDLHGLAENSAYLELTNVMGGCAITRLPQDIIPLTLSPPFKMDTDEPTSPLTPVAAYHLADPQTRQSQGLLLVSLETRSLDRSHALERERPLGEDQAQEAESL